MEEHNKKDSQENRMLVTGTGSEGLNRDLLCKIAGASLPKKDRDEKSVQALKSYFEELKPENPVEGMVYGQLYALNAHALELMNDANKTISVDAKDQYLKMANRLLKTFNASLEALGRYKRQGKQTVRVEKVVVGDGGQAIVGGNFEHG